LAASIPAANGLRLASTVLDGDSALLNSAHRLTPRQQEVLQLVAEGRSAKQVAGVLGISVRTAEAHKAHILEALGLHTTAELVRYALRNGIVTA